MGKSLAAASAPAREIFERADAALGLPLSAILFEGPEEELRRTRTTQPVTTGTPCKSPSMRSGAMIAGAAPAHNGEKRTDTAWADSMGATVTCSCSPAPQLLRAVPSIWIRPSCPSSEISARVTAIVLPVIFRMSPGRAPMRARSAGARRAMA